MQFLLLVQLSEYSQNLFISEIISLDEYVFSRVLLYGRLDTANIFKGNICLKMHTQEQCLFSCFINNTYDLMVNNFTQVMVNTMLLAIIFKRIERRVFSLY